MVQVRVSSVVVSTAVLSLALVLPITHGEEGTTWVADLGDVRVQCISPTLVRVEPKGQWGYEDRKTFMVQNRDFAGEPIMEWKDQTIRTKYYTVQIKGGGGVNRQRPEFQIFGTSGEIIYDTGDRAPGNKLHWPAPSEWKKSYALIDSPRFAVPEWTVSPLWDGAPVQPGTEKTNGYDFGNNVDGDTYVFLFTTVGNGDNLKGWNAAREQFASLSGPVPLLPDYAWGSWFTWWHDYSYETATAEIEKWDQWSFPLDIWGLDMEWRHIHENKDREYDWPNDMAFTDFDGWFKYLRGKNLHTFFNDHPYPKAPQTSHEEVAFRWTGLTKWMDMGVDFWWFDHNWKFCIPPPQVGGADKDADWQGLTNIAWGSHIYYSIVSHYDHTVRDPKDNHWYGRPMTLSKAFPPDASSGDDPGAHDESPGQHRYPVWWTGDKVPLQASVETMVDAGVYHYKPFVHSDCGGDGWFTHGDMMRWTAHCVFGNIIRFHGGPHQPWIFGSWWGDKIREYLNLRYMMLPSLLWGGQRAKQNGFPLVARCDLYWPEHGEESSSNHQYIFLDDWLVAPIWDSDKNTTDREVWIPPGEWQDAWNGEIVQGPTKVTASQPWERQPMWHRRDGGLQMLTYEAAQRVEWLDFRNITLEAFPCRGRCETRRTFYERGDTDDVGKTEIVMTTDGNGLVRIEIGATPYRREWTIRFNLRPEQQGFNATLDGQEVKVKSIRSRTFDDGSPLFSYFPFKGPGQEPASKAGPTAEIKVPAGSGKRVVQMLIGGALKHRKNCAWSGASCLDSRCCKISGESCFEKNAFFGICNETCSTDTIDPSDGKAWTCKKDGGSPELYKFLPVEPEEAIGTSLYCITLINSTIKNPRALLDEQKRLGAGIFSCNASDVFGVRVWASDPRVFSSVWDGVRKSGKFLEHDWTIKVQYDAVFLPSRLRQHLARLRGPKEAGIYIKKSNQWLGVGDELMVFSKNAVGTLLDNSKECAKKIKMWSETFSIISCMNANDVGFMEDFNLTAPYSETCEWKDEEAVVFQPYLTARGEKRRVQRPFHEWRQCYKQISGSVGSQMKFDATAAGDPEPIQQRLGASFDIFRTIIGAALGTMSFVLLSYLVTRRSRPAPATLRTLISESAECGRKKGGGYVTLQ